MVVVRWILEVLVRASEIEESILSFEVSQSGWCVDEWVWLIWSGIVSGSRVLSVLWVDGLALVMQISSGRTTSLEKMCAAVWRQGMRAVHPL